MPVLTTYPGVYIEEIPSGVRTITGVPTSITAFVGFASRGPVNEPTRIQSFPEFERVFGGLSDGSTMSYAVQQFFLNGGGDALIVRAVHTGDPTAAKNDKKATFTAGAFNLEACSEGAWGNKLRIRVDYHTSDPIDNTLFNLFVKDTDTGVIETFRNVSTTANNARYVVTVVEQQSDLIRVTAIGASHPPDDADVPLGGDPFSSTTSNPFGTDGQDGTGHDESDMLATVPNKKGVYAFDTADIFNLLVVTPVARDGVLSVGGRDVASNYCRDHRALFIVDPDPGWNEAGDIAGSNAAALGTFTGGMEKHNAALYFPYLRMSDALKDGVTDLFPPSGAVAGVMARTDGTRGVWKAPAGQDATLAGVQELGVKLDDGQNGQLNPIGVNCLRTFPAAGTVVWGARTLAGDDRLADQWKYLSVKRTALFLEESLYRGTQWVVFEPNDDPLWSQIRLNVGAFMQTLFRQGAFAGKTPREAYFVKCDGETTTQNDVNLGIVNIVVGFAPLKPAEFVIIQIQQMAGQIQT